MTPSEMVAANESIIDDSGLSDTAKDLLRTAIKTNSLFMGSILLMFGHTAPDEYQRCAEVFLAMVRSMAGKAPEASGREMKPAGVSS